MHKSKLNKNTRRTNGGFSIIQLIVTVAVVAVVSAFGLMGISRAKASIRLSGAAREYASYVEKARTFSIRSHADDASERASIVINADKKSYNVTMDLDGDSDLDTTTIPLPSDVEFDTIETISFDWRGRTWNTVNSITMSNAQVSIRLKNGIETVSVDVTGSGDVTVDSKVFDDSVPNVNLKVDNLAAGATPVPTPGVTATATPDSTATPTIDPTPTPIPTPTPGAGGTTPSPTPTPSSTPTPTPTPTPTATPTPSPSPTPSPTPTVCSLTVDKVTLLLGKQATTTITVSHNASTSLSITGTSSHSSDLQVSPNSQTVAAGGTASFTVKSKNSTGIFSVTFSTGCGSKTVPVTVIALL